MVFLAAGKRPRERHEGLVSTERSDGEKSESVVVAIILDRLQSLPFSEKRSNVGCITRVLYRDIIHELERSAVNIRPALFAAI